ncbi:MAG: DNA gyrase C-terminal beta-propeller domain-containing protein, partial [Lachnospiraceae bacterium]|nr:DNA gyrase C-terminal beta-propeller domain-containing protein [Lachnospiraceae bacterium]
LLIVSEKGMGKMTDMKEFTVQNRGGKGVKCYKITEKTGHVVGMKAVNEDNELMSINTEGIIIRMHCADISKLGRVTSGVKLINIPENEKVASIAKVRSTSAEIDGEEIEISDEDDDVEVVKAVESVSDEIELAEDAETMEDVEMEENPGEDA